jgi:hypothetical protein
MVRERGWTSTKVGQVWGVDLAWRTGLELDFGITVPVPGSQPGGRCLQVNLGTNLPSRTMGIHPSIKDTTIKKRNR